MQLVDIIIPVYDGLSETRNCLISLAESLSENQIECNVIVINDQSPNQELVEWLRGYCKENQIQFIENETNLGFVRTVNKGMTLSTNRDVILLNSDTIVANNWIDRLIDCAYSKPNIGTVTPVSNNATICSFPNFCQENPLPQMEVAQLDKVFSTVNYGCSVEIPTGVGFCMFIRRKCLKEVGILNEEAFGKGYGEENDFCCRASKLGWENIYCLDTFVAHVGSVSFSTKKEALVEHAMAKLEELHPGYHESIADHIQNDPAKIFRVRAYLDMICQSQLPKILLVSHNLNGGIETHIQELIQLYRHQAHFLVLKQKENQTYSLSFDQFEEEFQFQIPEQYQDLLYLLNILGLSLIHFHHLINIHPLLRNLGDDLGVELNFTVHDFYCVNGNPTLTNKKGTYCTDPDTRDQLCAQAVPLPCKGSPEDWRNEMRNFLSKCQRIITPSISTAEIFSSYFPEVDCQAAYHPDSELADYPSPTKWKPNKKTLKILTLGAISRVKGAELLEKTAVMAQSQGIKLEFHLMGYAYRPLNVCIKTHGPYKSEDLAAKLAKIKPDLIWLPAQWPETYSYTLSEALFAGIPVVVPDIGAFPERVSKHPAAQVYPWKSSPDEMIKLFSKLKTEGAPEEAAEFLPDHPEYSVDGFYEKQYLANLKCPAKVKAYYLSNEWITSFLVLEPFEKQLSRSERILVKIFHFRGTAAGRLLSQMVPFEFQRKFKQWLSKKPIHELTS
ncbi:glycosyltransferase [Gimesia sp.]|uniref:glycosyltransferase n=1 Tax=Gimesia sp. TaxID=2024833 RepID=UPI0025C0D572|nr:glycosyltransferase [Gimesia sp.]|tara:strand:+ start:9289 stop:11472 length:2184 start_codon:yes stop_codon:yes gene_type:complete